MLTALVIVEVPSVAVLVPVVESSTQMEYDRSMCGFSQQMERVGLGVTRDHVVPRIRQCSMCPMRNLTTSSMTAAGGGQRKTGPQTVQSHCRCSLRNCSSNDKDSFRDSLQIHAWTFTNQDWKMQVSIHGGSAKVRWQHYSNRGAVALAPAELR
eukprot:COSAG02_NODE_37_length_48203_cov_57.745708_3_plen_154_part_00